MEDRREQIAARIKMLEALTACFQQPHVVVDIIANAEDRSSAERALTSTFGIDSAQAGMVMDARLTRWTAGERQSLQAELQSLRELLLLED